MRTARVGDRLRAAPLSRRLPVLAAHRAPPHGPETWGARVPGVREGSAYEAENQRRSLSPLPASSPEQTPAGRGENASGEVSSFDQFC